MFTVGVTGGIGSGKSTVCRVFGVLGIPVFDSDAEAKRLLGRDASVRRDVAEAFGADIYDGSRLDRAALAARVFNDPDALQRLNAIVHPAVRSAFEEWAARQQAPYVINEAAILVETRAWKRFGHLVVVSAPEDVRLARVMQRDGVSAQQVRARMRNQADDATREAAAGTIIVNDGHTLVIPQVLAAHEQILKFAD